MNIGDLYASSLAAASASADLILVSPDTYTGFTPSDRPRVVPGFIFQIVGNENVSLQTDITDHYVEDNTSRQDHVSLKPIQIVVSGFVGELNNVTPIGLAPFKAALDRLGVLDSYIPSITNTARRAYNTANQIFSLGEKIKAATGAAVGIDVKTKQQKAFSDLAQYQRNRTLFYVSTPFGQFSNMVISAITADQSADTKSLSDFSITFKEIRLAQTQLTFNGANRIDDFSNVKGTA
jgi:hypothetical protein